MDIQSNIKGQIDLRRMSPYLFVHGANGSGKSAVAHSVELACFGGVSDAAGRDVKQKSLVGHLAPEGEELRAYVGFEGGLSFNWPTKERYGMVNPLAIATEVMTGSTHKMLVYLLKNMDDDHEVRLDYANWDAVVKRHGTYRTALVEMYENCNSCIRSYRAKLREHASVLQWLRGAGMQDQIKGLEIMISEDEDTVQSNKALLDSVLDEMYGFVEGALPELEQKMLPFIPDGMDAPKFSWLDGQLRLGFEGRPVPSGVEMIALAVALAIVTVPDESDSRHVWILPDRAYDPVTLGNIMRVLRGLFCRAVVIQSTILPEGYDFTDYGWELVEV